MRQVDIHEAKTHLSRPVEAAARGESFVIARAGRALVRVTAVEAPTDAARRRTGFLSGRIAVPDDFDRLGAAEIEALFGGRP